MSHSAVKGCSDDFHPIVAGERSMTGNKHSGNGQHGTGQHGAAVRYRIWLARYSDEPPTSPQDVPPRCGGTRTGRTGDFFVARGDSLRSGVQSGGPEPARLQAPGGRRARGRAVRRGRPGGTRTPAAQKKTRCASVRRRRTTGSHRGMCLTPHAASLSGRSVGGEAASDIPS